LFPFNIEKIHLIILFPGFSIATAEAYSQVKVQPEKRMLEELLTINIKQWKEQIHNDFEEHLFGVYPVLQEIKADLYHSGAVYASISGSGSAIYGIFEEKPVLSNNLKEKVVFEGPL
jgi:4-diphosphocytidyl-2-C-methyl-D-erythritol kinase